MPFKTPRFVTNRQLKLIRQVLSDAGYSAKVWSISPPNLAARTLIALLQNGMTDPVDLARELETRFGQPGSNSAALAMSLRRLVSRGFSIQYGVCKLADPDVR